VCDASFVLHTIAPLFFIYLHSGLHVVVDFLRLRRAVIQRRSSLKAQGAAKNGCGEVLPSSFFSCSCVKKSPACGQKGARN
jgi:hypothetical protein